MVFILMAIATTTIAQSIDTCWNVDRFNDLIKNMEVEKVYLSEGTHLTDGLLVKRSDLEIIIPIGCRLILRDSAKLDPMAFGGKSNAVLKVEGTISSPIKNITIDLQGEIDGNKLANPYEKGGVEGINFIYVQDSKIKGSGQVVNCNGDGIDLDAVEGLLVSDVTVKSNGGSGIHFGSPRPITASSNSLIQNVSAIDNGFRAFRNGFDVSWPNKTGIVFYDCYAANNYRNWEIHAEGTVLINCRENQSNRHSVSNDFSDAEYVDLNGLNQTDKSFISTKNWVMFKRDLKSFFGYEIPDHLKGLNL